MVQPVNMNKSCQQVSLEDNPGLISPSACSSEIQLMCKLSNITTYESVLGRFPIAQGKLSNIRTYEAVLGKFSIAQGFFRSGRCKISNTNSG